MTHLFEPQADFFLWSFIVSIKQSSNKYVSHRCIPHWQTNYCRINVS